MGLRKLAKFWGFDWVLKRFLVNWILGEVQRRGADVNTPKIGSRVGEFCFGGILGIHAVLRRELIWGN
jgi:hypothetical protein